jgi:hypothetical protein
VRKQRRLYLTTTIAELISEDPNRTSFIVQNVDDESVVGIYVRKEEPVGSLWLYPHSWIYFEKQDDADAQWWAKTDTGTAYVRIIEFYREAPTPKPTWLPY